MQENSTPQPQLGTAYSAEVGDNGQIKTTEAGPGGIETGFFRHTDQSIVFPNPSEEQQWNRVLQFIKELSASPVPLKIKTKSNLGSFSESLFLGVNYHFEENENERIQGVDGVVVARVAFCAYAKGTGLFIPNGQFGLVGHRDLVIVNGPSGVFVYTDKKLPFSDYIPPKEARWSFWQGNQDFFRNHYAIQRWKPADSDPYNVGLGSLLQATAVAWILKTKNIEKVQTNILLPDGERMWAKYGLEGSKLNRQKAIKQISQDIIDHVR